MTMLQRTGNFLIGVSAWDYLNVWAEMCELIFTKALNSLDNSSHKLDKNLLAIFYTIASDSFSALTCMLGPAVQLYVRGPRAPTKFFCFWDMRANITLICAITPDICSVSREKYQIWQIKSLLLKTLFWNQFVCFTWQFINSPDLMFCPQDEKYFKIWGWLFTLWGPQHLSQPVTCEWVCSPSLLKFLVPWESVQSVNRLEMATGGGHGWVWPTRAILFFLFSITKKSLLQ